VVRTVVAGLFLAIGVVVVWQIYHDNQSKKLIEALAHSSVIWLSSSVGSAQRVSELSAQSNAKTSDQAAQTPTATSIEANELAELRQQILAVVNDLAVLRRDVEQLSGKHEGLSRNVETVKASLQDVGEKISSLSSVPTPAPVSSQAQPRRSVPRLVRAEAPRSDAAPVPPKTSRQPDAASVAPTTSPTGTASLTEQPPRPPLPVPVPTAETTSPLH